MNELSSATAQPPHRLGAVLVAVLTALLHQACAPDAHDHGLGALALGLTSERAGITYRLDDARFSLAGPESHELLAMGEDELSLELPPGDYALTLHEGYRLRTADAGAPLHDARLVSQNPTSVQIRAGETARVTLRFELLDGPRPDAGPGTLEVGIAIGPDDGGLSPGLDGGAAHPGTTGVARDGGTATPRTDAGLPGGSQRDAGATRCVEGLRLNEIDYEQPQSDVAEFVELVNAGACAATLGELTVELVNGTDGKTYGRYPLGGAGTAIAPGGRLVLGDEAVLRALPPGTLQLPLNGAGLQNGPDGVRLVHEGRVLDAIAYEGPVPNTTESQPATADDDDRALARCPDGHDTNDGAQDLRLVAPTPGAPNGCAN